MTLLNLIFPLKKAYAHCDIPCGVYESKPAQMAAESVEKMVQKILELPTEGDAQTLLAARNSFVRMVRTKEDQAELCKRGVLVLWTDFFKEENLTDFPNLHDLIWKTTKLCSTNKREVSAEAAKALRENVDKIAEIFSKVKTAAKK